MKLKKSKEYKNWQSIDPLCKKFAHYNVFCNFLIAYAIKHKLNTDLSVPKKQKCELCNKSFFENEVTPPIIERFSINHLFWCQECISKIVFQNSGTADISELEIVDYLHNIADVINRVPTANFGEGINDFIDLMIKNLLDYLD